MCQVNAEQIDIIFRTNDFLVVSKPARVHFDEILTHIVVDQPENWEAVHRLDYETSGCLLLAKKDLALTLRKQFSGGVAKKLYLAGSTHKLGDEFLDQEIKGYIGSRYRSSKKVSFHDARFTENLKQLEKKFHSFQTTRHVVRNATAEESTYARDSLGFTGEIYAVELITGARHQIRAFFASCDAAIVGDPVYGVATEDSRLELHAYRLSFENPLDSNVVVSVQTQ